MDLGVEHCGTQYLSCAQLLKDLVGLTERERRGLGPDSGPGHNPEEIQSVLPCEIGNRYQLPFFPENIVRKAWNIAHMDSGTYHPAALAHRAQCRWHQFSGDDGGVERGVRPLVRRAGPHRAEPSGKVLRRGVTGARESIDRPA